MPIDVHAHYVPPSMIEALDSRGNDFGISLQHGPGCQCALHFDDGPKVRPFFPKLIEPLAARLGTMDKTGIGRQVLSSWADVFGPQLPLDAAKRWHGFLNEHLARVCSATPERFSMLASVPLPHAADAAAELERAVRNLGAIGAVIPANVADVNLGDLDLDPFWQTAVGLNVGVFIHPVQAVPVKRSARHGLTQIVQYTSDTSLSVGSLIFSGVLDRFPMLRLLLSHGGGALPYLIGRFDCMHERMDRAAQGDVAQAAPSAYLRSFYYDTIVHDPGILRWLASRVGLGRVVLGSDYSFPPADRDPVATVRRAGFSAAETEAILDDNALALFPALRQVSAKAAR
jgi:aminocarboxymuconate-semialdehyde decarboxylase